MAERREHGVLTGVDSIHHENVQQSLRTITLRETLDKMCSVR